MSVTVNITELENVLRRRIMKRIGQFTVNSTAYKAAIIKIAQQLEAEAKLNVRRQRLIDTGRLLNSIRYQIRRDGNRQIITAGSFGVPYAAVHEFGMDRNVTVRSHLRVRGGTSFSVRSHDRHMKIPKRPFLKPAFEKVAPKAVDILMDLFRLQK